MDPFLTWTSSSTLTNPRLSTENQLTQTFMSATTPVPLHRPKTVSSESTSYAPPNLQAIQQTTKVHHSILDNVLPLPPNHHQKHQKIFRIPRHQSHRLIMDYLTGRTHQNEDNTYNGQMNRPLIERIKEHESHSRLHLHNPNDYSHNKSAPANHSRTSVHNIAWDRTTIIFHQLGLLRHS